MAAEDTFLVVGLGNPGSEYQNTRHNVGFMVVDYLAGQAGATIESSKWSSYFAKVQHLSKRIFFIKPDTYMNRSGQAVKKFLNFYDCPLSNVLVIHDDIDMHPGRLKLSCGGGSGGHNGIKSIAQHLSSNEFCRLKFGIGRPGQGDVHPDFPVDKYVLSSFTSQEQSLINDRLEIIQQGLDVYLTEGTLQSMTIINSVK